VALEPANESDDVGAPLEPIPGPLGYRIALNEVDSGEEPAPSPQQGTTNERGNAARRGCTNDRRSGPASTVPCWRGQCSPGEPCAPDRRVPSVAPQDSEVHYLLWRGIAGVQRRQSRAAVLARLNGGQDITARISSRPLACGSSPQQAAGDTVGHAPQRDPRQCVAAPGDQLARQLGNLVNRSRAVAREALGIFCIGVGRFLRPGPRSSGAMTRRSRTSRASSPANRSLS
jgi:hypothetical protein